jgi:ACS family glucarate transporter-like MFS transporter
MSAHPASARHDAPPTPAAGRQARPTRVRYLILAMLFLATTINFADRATMAIAGPEIKRLFNLSPVEMGYIFSAFAWSYMMAQMPGGWLLDRFGSKMTYFFSIMLWSTFTLLQGTVGFFTGGVAVALLFALRLLVGAAEAPSFPGNSRLTSTWFPTAERGRAVAVFNSAQYFATVLFAPLMGWLVHGHGWESVFYVMGALGILTALVWLRTVYAPKDHPRVNQAELDYIAQGGALIDLDDRQPAASRQQIKTWQCIKEMLSNRMLLGVYIGQYSISTLTYFFLTWFPVYLVQERHMTILKAGLIAALPAVAGFVGGILGGVLSDRLLKANCSLAVARKTPIVVGMLLSMSVVICNYVTADWLVIGIMSLAFFGKGVGALGWAVVADTSPKEAAGLSGGLFNTFGNISGITTPIVIGYLLQGTGSFAAALVFIGANAALAVVCYLFVVGPIRRFEFRQSPYHPTAG